MVKAIISTTRKSLWVCLAFSALVMAGISPASAACAVPNQLTNGQTADATAVMTNLNALSACIDSQAPAGTNNALQYNNGAGSFGGLSLSNGQVPIGSTGNTPQAGTLTAGSGISIANGPGSITISAAGASVSPFVDPASIPITKPVASAFTVINSTGSTATATDMASRGVAFSTPSGPPNYASMEQPVANATAFTVTALVYPTGYLNGNWFWGIGIKDTAGKYVGFGFRNTWPVAYFQFSSINASVNGSTATSIVNPQNPVWVRVKLSGGQFIFTFSFDGENFLPGWTVSATDYISSNIATVGLITINNTSSQNLILDVFSWTNVSP